MTLKRIKTRRVLKSIAVGAIFSVLSGCSASGSNSSMFELRKDGDTIFLSGELTDQAATQFNENLANDVRRVVITSQGGDVAAALDIAEKIAELELVVEARQFCLSACAAYVWMSGSKKRIAERTIVALHHGSTPFVNLYSRLGPEFLGASPSQLLRDNALRERELYSKVKVDVRILDLSERLRGLICLGMIGREDGTISIQPRYEMAGIIPDNEFWAIYGVKVERGESLTDPDQIEALLKEVSTAATNYRFAIARAKEASLSNFDQEQAQPLPVLPRCPNH